jgi:hypothetical protein
MQEKIYKEGQEDQGTFKTQEITPLFFYLFLVLLALGITLAPSLWGPVGLSWAPVYTRTLDALSSYMQLGHRTGPCLRASSRYVEKMLAWCRDLPVVVVPLVAGIALGWFS